MAQQIDREGVFRVEILESSLSATKAKMPQFVARMKATQKYVDDAAGMAHFGLTEPGWVDWSGYDQEITGFFQLIYTDKKTGEMKTMFTVEPIMAITGWDGASFASLAAINAEGKAATIWVNENHYEGKVSLRADNIDVADAPPVRGLRTLATEEVKDLDAQFAMLLPGRQKAAPAAKAPAKPSAPAVPPAAKAAPAPAAKAAPAPAPAAKPAPAVAPVTNGSVAAVAEDDLPAELTMDEAWAKVNEIMPTASDDDRAKAWTEAGEAVLKGADTATGAQWVEIVRFVREKYGAPFA